MSRPLGPLGIDPLYFSLSLFGILGLYVLYLLLPRGIRVHYFQAYPKRHIWSARPRRRRNGASSTSSQGGMSMSGTHAAASNLYARTGQYMPSSNQSLGSTYSTGSRNRGGSYNNAAMEEMINFESTAGIPPTMHNQTNINHISRQGVDGPNNGDDPVISAAMQQLRDPGVLIVAHGSRGKPKTVRLQLTNNSITWRTETRKKNQNGQYTKEVKLGKLHSVSLVNIMYVDVGKQTTALRRAENAAVPESLCFSLLTKEGSLDLEANSPRERDALVSSFSLVLDQVHAQDWRDIYRGPSAEMPSSFDEYDEEAPAQQR